MVEEKNTTYPQPHCPKCGSPLRLIHERKDWFCDTCKNFPKTSAEISSNVGKGTKKGRNKFWIYYYLAIIAIIVLLVCESFVFRLSFSVFLIYAIVLIISVPLSVLLCKYVMSKR